VLYPRTKIVCTLGPSTATVETLRSLMEAGLSVARLNFSHGTHEQHARTVEMVRATARELGRPVAILGDLQGPRIRIGDMTEPREVRNGEDVVLVAGEQIGPGQFPTTYEHLCEDVKVGDRILVDDGLIELVALEVDERTVTARSRATRE
jgi:pyruvate kinase